MSTPARQDAAAEPETDQLVTMTVDDQLFGLPILRVQDIVEPGDITPVPQAPSAVAGLLNLRGRVVTVIDLRVCLDAAPTYFVERPISVTVERRGDLYTLLVDSIGDVRTLPRADFTEVPAMLDPAMQRLCSGVYRLDSGYLAVLDVDRLLDPERLAAMPARTRPRLHAAKRKVTAADIG